MEHLADPRAHVPGSSMPTFFMSKAERRAIAAYLTSQKASPVPAEPAEQYKALCGRCHGEKGDGNGPVAETLLPRPRIFTNAQFFNWLPEERAFRAIREGVPGTAMPPFGKQLDEKQAQALFGYVRATFIGAQRTQPPQPRKVPERNPVTWSAESVARGKAAFLDRCAGCHGRIGDGKGPNSPQMLPRPRNLTTRLFFEKLPDTRLFESITFGIVGTGMPSWDYLAEDQRWDLVNYVRFLSSTGPAVTKEQK
jgi:mono/diheme cytochrome c family protein